jgi:nicotinic acid mononucleotide adenylyltransferase
MAAERREAEVADRLRQKGEKGERFGRHSLRVGLDGRRVREQAAAGRLFLLGQPLQPESASDVRRRIANREDWRELVPPPVAAFIIASGLYSSRACDPSPL